MTALVIGIGHPFRGDDSVGPLVAEMIAALKLPGVETLPHHGEGTDLMERWQGFERVVVVDATVSGAPCGTIRQWDGVQPLPSVLFPKGSHVFGLAEAVDMARLLERLPPSLTIIGVEGADFTLGAPLSAAVTAALSEVVVLCERHLRMAAP